MSTEPTLFALESNTVHLHQPNKRKSPEPRYSKIKKFTAVVVPDDYMQQKPREERRNLNSKLTVQIGQTSGLSPSKHEVITNQV